MEVIKKVAAVVLSLSIICFTLIAILSIWGVLADDVAGKSLSSLGVLLVAALLTLITLKILEGKKN